MTEHVAVMGKRRGAQSACLGKHERKRPLGILGVDGRIILKLIFNK
jgi:hypothetical protein